MDAIGFVFYLDANTEIKTTFRQKSSPFCVTKSVSHIRGTLWELYDAGMHVQQLKPMASKLALKLDFKRANANKASISF
jgi:hypothetical protein